MDRTTEGGRLRVSRGDFKSARWRRGRRKEGRGGEGGQKRDTWYIYRSVYTAGLTIQLACSILYMYVWTRQPGRQAESHEGGGSQVNKGMRREVKRLKKEIPRRVISAHTENVISPVKGFRVKGFRACRPQALYHKLQVLLLD